MDFNLTDFSSVIELQQKLNTTNPMILQPQTSAFSRRNSIVGSFNPEESMLSASRMNSPTLRLGKVRSWKFIYKSPPRIEQIKSEGPLAFNKQAHKLVVRKLPKFHEQIMENDPLKNSKIVENINFFREQQKRKQDMNESQAKTLERTRVSNDQFEVSRVLVNLRNQKNSQHLNMSRSLSCSYARLDNSRLSVIEGLKSGEELYKSIIRQDGSLLESRVLEARKGQGRVNMAESQYFGGIIGK